MKIIRSRSNSEFQELARLAGSSRQCRARGLTLIEGERLLSALSDSGHSAETLIISESASLDTTRRTRLESFPGKKRIVLADNLFANISQVVNSQGLMGISKIPDPGSWPTGPTTALLLEGIQDPGNLGSIFRTAVAAGIQHVALSPGSAYAWSPKVMRAGMGAHFHLSIHEDADLFLLASGSLAAVAATSPHSDVSLYDTRLSVPITWIFGNEGAGLSPELTATATLRLKVPMAKGAESLNVAAAVAICLFEQTRQRSPQAKVVQR